tara:strand:+ start:262 stop:414 length:153 start_codon:yes stop_codon:yes gene_type:complete
MKQNKRASTIAPGAEKIFRADRADNQLALSGRAQALTGIAALVIVSICST